MNHNTNSFDLVNNKWVTVKYSGYCVHCTVSVTQAIVFRLWYAVTYTELLIGNEFFLDQNTTKYLYEYIGWSIQMYTKHLMWLVVLLLFH